eukprot:SM000028S10149  [mRNA]  locus=s28:644041:644531:+ [translate_table: standard]
MDLRSGRVLDSASDLSGTAPVVATDPSAIVPVATECVTEPSEVGHPLRSHVVNMSQGEQPPKPRYQGTPGGASLAEGCTISRKAAMTLLSPHMSMEASDVYRNLKKSILAQTKPIVADASPAERALGPQLIDDPVDGIFKRLAQQFPV